VSICCFETALASSIDIPSMNLRKGAWAIAPVLVVDAVPGPEMEGVVIYDDLGYKIYSSGHSPVGRGLPINAVRASISKLDIGRKNSRLFVNSLLLLSAGKLDRMTALAGGTLRLLYIRARWCGFGIEPAPLGFEGWRTPAK
jgi:hypothetical protein